MFDQNTRTGPATVSAIVLAPPFGEHLVDSVRSVLAQRYPSDRLEVIVADDGADRCAAPLLAPFGDRVRRVVGADGRAALDAAIAQARGELIALQYAEDEWTPDKLAAQVAVLQSRPEVGLVYGDMAVVDDDGAELCPSWWEACGITPHRGRPLGALMRGNFVPAGTLVVRASLRERFLPLSVHPGCEDWWIASRVAEVAELDYVRAPVLRFRGPGRDMGPDAQGIPQPDRLHELPLRRWLLTQLRCGAVAPVDLLAGCERFEHCALSIAAERNLPLSVVVPVDERDIALARAAVGIGEAALRAGDLRAAARAAARACGHDLQGAHVRRLLDRVREAVARGGVAAETGRLPDPPARATPALRSFVTIALADELVRSPELLRSYADTFAAEDDASLLMVLDDPAPAAMHSLVAAVVHAGLDTGSGPDLVATALAPGATLPAALLQRAAALLSPYEQEGPLGDLPRVDADSVGQLRVWMQGT